MRPRKLVASCFAPLQPQSRRVMPAPAFSGKATVAGGAGKTARSAGRKQQQMPMCDYGAACTRKGCVYRHPPKPKRDAASEQHERGGTSVAEEQRYDGGQLYPRSSFMEEYGEQGAAFWERAERPAAPERDADSDAPVCVAFLAGVCTYGARCQGQHPPPDVAEAFRQRYASIPCQWGESCRTASCLYQHPWDRWEEGQWQESRWQESFPEDVGQALDEATRDAPAPAAPAAPAAPTAPAAPAAPAAAVAQAAQAAAVAPAAAHEIAAHEAAQSEAAASEAAPSEAAPSGSAASEAARVDAEWKRCQWAKGLEEEEPETQAQLYTYYGSLLTMALLTMALYLLWSLRRSSIPTMARPTATVRTVSVEYLP